MEQITCLRCDRAHDFSIELKAHNFVVTCNNCGKFIKNVSYKEMVGYAQFEQSFTRKNPHDPAFEIKVAEQESRRYKSDIIYFLETYCKYPDGSPVVLNSTQKKFLSWYNDKSREISEYKPKEKQAEKIPDARQNSLFSPKVKKESMIEKDPEEIAEKEIPLFIKIKNFFRKN